MFRFGFFWRLLLALLLVGVLAAGGMALFRAGWAQGYQTGALSAAPSGSEVAPRAPSCHTPLAGIRCQAISELPGT